MQSLVAPEEALDMKMVWEAPDDDWEAYIHTHMEAIRAKYFPKNAQAKVLALTPPPDFLLDSPKQSATD